VNGRLKGWDVDASSGVRSVARNPTLIYISPRLHGATQSRTAVELRERNSNKCAVRNCCLMCARNEAVLRKVPGYVLSSSQSCRNSSSIPVEEGKHLGGTRSVAPIAHEFTSDGEHRKDLHASCTHAIVGLKGSLLIEGSGSVRVGKNGVASVPERQSKKTSASLWQKKITLR